MLTITLSTILTRIPVWVFPLFVGLMALGWMQTKERKLNRTRVVVMPLAMLAFSLFSVLSLFGTSTLALFAWAFGLSLGAGLSFQFVRREGMQFDANKNEFTLPGSFLPWVLIAGIFCLRFVVGAMGATGAVGLHSAMVVGAIALLGGLFSGCFAGRALALLQTQVSNKAFRGATPA
jgi:hypothetical protein